MNFIPINLIYAKNEPFATPNELVYINAGRIENVRPYTPGPYTGSNTQLRFSANVKGWRDRYTDLFISDATATIQGYLNITGSYNRATLSVNSMGVTNFISPVSIQVNLNQILWFRSNPLAVTISGVSYAGGTTTEMWVQSGEWGASKWIITTALAATIALLKTNSDAMFTVVKTIGGVGVAGTDFNFVTATNQTAQPINLGSSIIPAGASVLKVSVLNTAVFSGAVSLGVTVGPTTGTNTYLASTNLYAAGSVADVTTLPTTSSSASAVWVGATPGANWSLNTGGVLKVAITYIDNVNS
jgi:hypothetical protein